MARPRPRALRRIGSAVFMAALAVAPVARAGGQVTWAPESFDEIESLVVRADVAGPARDASRLAAVLEEAITGQLRRAEIRFLHPPSREGCCILRLDVRLVPAPPRLRGALAYTLRLELARQESYGYPAWVILWASKPVGGFLESADLQDLIRAAARDAADEFVDLFRARFPL